MSRLLSRAMRPAVGVIVVPPGTWLDRPSLGVHLLQGIARHAGHEVQVVYANMLYAAAIGERSYAGLVSLQYGLALGERLFARGAFGGPALGRDAGAGLEPKIARLQEIYRAAGKAFPLDMRGLRALEQTTAAWLEELAATLAAGGYRFVGCTSVFEQHAAAIAILNGVKRHAPDTLTLIGGANCEGEMAEGVRALSELVDVVFSGESEGTFAELLPELATGARPARRIVEGTPCTTLDELPTPDYADYYRQLEAFLPGSAVPSTSWLTYESSRGCWWGQKSHCTFCGLNGQGMAFREKSPDRVIAELETLLAVHPTKRVMMADNIMPHAYYRTLLPRLAEELPGVTVAYEQKANITLAQVCDLARAGVTVIQPGIESLSTEILRLIAKGTTAPVNIALLRYARAAGLSLAWNILYGIPGDKIDQYAAMAGLLPLLKHLHPAKRVNPTILDRFSPYHSHPERFAIRDLRPLPEYASWLPEGVPLEKIAYHFEGTFASESLAHMDVIRELTDELTRWRESWFRNRAELRVERVGERGYRLHDTRGLGLPPVQDIDESQAIAAMVARPAAALDGAVRRWALGSKVVAEIDGKVVPLAVAEVPLFGELEDRFRLRVVA